MCSQAWRRRRVGGKLRNHHSAQATADVISEIKDVGDAPETEHQDQKQGDIEIWFDICLTIVELNLDK